MAAGTPWEDENSVLESRWRKFRTAKHRENWRAGEKSTCRTSRRSHGISEIPRLHTARGGGRGCAMGDPFSPSQRPERSKAMHHAAMAPCTRMTPHRMGRLREPKLPVSTIAITVAL